MRSSRRKEVIGLSSAHEPVSAEQWSAFLVDTARGVTVEGRVVSVVPFGAFIELGHGVHGVLHMSQWHGEPAEGETLRLRILEVDPERQRVSLTAV